MLCISRNTDQGVFIGKDLYVKIGDEFVLVEGAYVKILEGRNGKKRLGITASRHVEIMREELLPQQEQRDRLEKIERSR